jgi:hypothetical protein
MKNVIIPEIQEDSVTLEEISTNPNDYLVVAYIDNNLLGFLEDREGNWVLRTTSDRDEYVDYYYDSLFSLVLNLKDDYPNLILKVKVNE